MATLDDLLTVTADEEATPEEEVAALQRLISSGSWGFEGSVAFGPNSVQVIREEHPLEGHA